jgi:hypothetical protein
LTSILGVLKTDPILSTKKKELFEAFFGPEAKKVKLLVDVCFCPQEGTFLLYPTVEDVTDRQRLQAMINLWLNERISQWPTLCDQLWKRGHTPFRPKQGTFLSRENMRAEEGKHPNFLIAPYQATWIKAVKDKLK